MKLAFDCTIEANHLNLSINTIIFSVQVNFGSGIAHAENALNQSDNVPNPPNDTSIAGGYCAASRSSYDLL
jgi:hypothetical protein